MSPRPPCLRHRRAAALPRGLLRPVPAGSSYRAVSPGLTGAMRGWLPVARPFSPRRFDCVAGPKTARPNQSDLSSSIPSTASGPEGVRSPRDVMLDRGILTTNSWASNLMRALVRMRCRQPSCSRSVNLEVTSALRDFSVRSCVTRDDAPGQRYFRDRLCRPMGGRFDL